MRFHDPPRFSLAQQISITLLSASLVFAPLAQAKKYRVHIPGVPDKYNPLATSNPLDAGKNTVEKTAEVATDVAEVVVVKPVTEVALPVAEGVVHLHKEATEEVVDGAKSVGRKFDDEIIQPTREGFKHFGHEAGQELRKAGRSVDTYVDEHTGEILLAVAVAGMIVIACPCAVTVMGMEVGTVGLGMSGAVATAAVVPRDADERDAEDSGYSASSSPSPPDSTPEPKHAPAQEVPPAASPTLVSTPPYVNPNQLRWDFGGRLLSSKTNTTGYEGDNAIAKGIAKDAGKEAAKGAMDLAKDAIKDSIGPLTEVAKSSAERSAALIGKSGGLVLESVETAPNSVDSYSTDGEYAARLDNLLGQAAMQAQHRQANDPNFTPAKPWAPDPNWAKKTGPTIGATPAAPRPPLSLEESNRVKAQALGVLTNLTPEEVQAKVQGGLLDDYAKREERFAKQWEPQVQPPRTHDAPYPEPVPTPSGGPVPQQAPATTDPVPVPGSTPAADPAAP